MSGEREDHGHGHRHDHGPGHGGPADPSALMERARSYATERGLPFTDMRQRVLGLLAREAVPLSAYEIVDRLSRERKVQAVQVYRALAFLQEAGCVHRLSSKSSYFACGHSHEAGDTVVFMVCSHCGAVQEAPSDLVARGLRDAADATGFRPVTPIIEIEGSCAACAATDAT